MKKTFYPALCMVVLFTLLFGACEKAPEQKAFEEKEEQKKAEKYVSFEEAKRQIKSFEEKSVRDFHFGKPVDISEMKDISVIKLKPYRDSSPKKLEETLAAVWDMYKNTDWDKAEVNESSREDNNRAYTKTDRESGNFYSCDTTTGFFAGNTKSIWERELWLDSCVKQYDFRKESISENQKKDAWPVGGKDVTVGEAVAYTEERLNQNLAPLEKKEFQYKVQLLYVLQDEETKNCDFSMVIGRVYRGVSLATQSDFDNNEEGKYPWRHCGSHILIIMRDGCEIDYFNVCDEVYGIASAQKQEKIISPEWAVEKMDREIAHIGGASCSFYGLVYLLTQKRGEEKTPDGFEYSYSHVDENTYLRPYWIFASPAHWDFREGQEHDDGLEEITLIDAADGSLYYYQMTGGY